MLCYCKETRNGNKLAELLVRLSVRTLPRCLLFFLIVAFGSVAQTTTEGERNRTAPAAIDEKQFIWRDPGAVESLDFAGGPGGRENAPHPPFVFSEDLPGGTSPKVMVTDARRARWIVKWGPEVKAETFATRIAWAAGYHVEPSYFVREGNIDSPGKVTKASGFIDRKNNGYFRDARFKLLEPEEHMLPTSNWSLVDNPFVGTPQLHGLKIVMMLVSNWDVKDARSSDGPNTALVEIGEGGRKDTYYVVEDWGASMGKWGDFFTRSKWDCKGFESQTSSFTKGVDANGAVGFGFTGKRTHDMVRGIKVDDVRWLMQYLGRVTDEQLRAGLEASGATADEVSCFSNALRERINQLQKVARGTEPKNIRSR